ncbi:uncharacterized protein LOC132868243 [Neoarius graeffei]|uniref:uncharacterized protein LOC132868243 n=1 Tax=Neoarius graeffei TaxID=443677 RepID=UPI00298D001E|nr:uncharacterized protein LOC132868243 [Neoarius graeffei]
MRNTAKPLRDVGNVSPVTPIPCMSSTALRTSLLIDTPATVPLLSSHTAAPHQKANPCACQTLLASGSKHKADTPMQFYPSKISKKMNTVSVGEQARQNMSGRGVQTKTSITRRSIQTVMTNRTQSTQASFPLMAKKYKSSGTQTYERHTTTATQTVQSNVQCSTRTETTGYVETCVRYKQMLLFNLPPGKSHLQDKGFRIPLRQCLISLTIILHLVKRHHMMRLMSLPRCHLRHLHKKHHQQQLTRKRHRLENSLFVRTLETIFF